MLFATAIRMHNLGLQSLWFDEGWSAFAASQPSLLDAARADSTNPPLYYVLLNAATRFWGDSEFALRLFSTLVCLLVIALTYRLAAQLFGRSAGVLAALLAALSTLLWWASQEARMYTLLALLVMVCALAWHSLLRKPSTWAWLSLLSGEIGALYTHNTGPLIIIWLNLLTLAAWAGSRQTRRPDVRLWILGQIGVVAVYLPWLVTYFVRLPAANSAVTSAPQINTQLVADIWQAYLTGLWGLINQHTELMLLCGAAAVMSALLTPWQKPAARWLALHVIILTSGVVLGLMALENELHGRYFVMAAPLLVVLFAGGIARIPSAWLRAVAALPFILLLVIVMSYAQRPEYVRDDARAMAQYYAQTLSSTDTVLAWSYADRYELAYYWSRLGVTARRITLPEGADLDIIAPMLPNTGTVSLNIWYTQRADYRAMLPCILNHFGADVPQTHTAAGMTDVRFSGWSGQLPIIVPAAVVFGQAGSPVTRLAAHGQLPSTPAAQAVCIPLVIELLSPVGTQFKAAVIVHNPQGWEIARDDPIFATANQQTSEQMLLGKRLTAYALLRLPYGAPPGDYPVYLRIYDEQRTPSGYQPIVSDDIATAGRDVLLGIWHAQEGSRWEDTNRAPALPYEANLVVTDSLTLVAHDLAAQQSPRHGGEWLRMSLLWTGQGALPTLELQAEDGSWSVEIPPSHESASGVVLEWREVQVPVSAAQGMADLRIPGGHILTRVPVEVLPAQMTAPAVGQAVTAEFQGVGSLVGYTLDSLSVSRSETPTITLVWQAGAAPITADYTVFVQLLDSGGMVIAQSDSVPGEGMRATSGWRAGEFIVDSHWLTFNINAHPGAASIHIGLYDPSTNRRVALADGSDAFVIQETLIVR
jgi:uncharacterized membrane protein